MEIREVGPPPIFSILTVWVREDVNKVSVDVLQMSGRVVFQKKFEKTCIPTNSSLKKQVTAHLIDTTVITMAQTVKLVRNNEQPSARKKSGRSMGRRDPGVTRDILNLISVLVRKKNFMCFMLSALDLKHGWVTVAADEIMKLVPEKESHDVTFALYG